LNECKKLDKFGIEPDIQQIQGDIYRKLGTMYRLDKNLDQSKKCYTMSKKTYPDKCRGLVWLTHGWAEYYRSMGYNSMTVGESKNRVSNTNSDNHFDEALKICKEAKDMSLKVRNINRYAHALLIECEINRLKIGSSLNLQQINEMKSNYAQALEIYLNINSNWGCANLFISQYLAFKNTDAYHQEYYDLLDYAKEICENMGFNRELSLIERILSDTADPCELNPSSLF
jgi:tetratricopeptide (TPR) repeat protein